MSGVDLLRAIARQRRDDFLAHQARAEAAVPRTLIASPVSFYDALAAPGLSLIAEIKRASPSRGTIATIECPVALAHAYQRGGARAISVLTEPHRFGGQLQDLQSVAAAVTAPALRKDFLTLPGQLDEARHAGASAALLIAALFDDVHTLQSLIDHATRVGLDTLVEVHTADELDRALEAGARIVGVNHRNLVDFSMDMSLFERLQPRIPKGVLAVAESGIGDAQTARRMAESGADAILVGEHLASAGDPEQATRTLLGAELEVGNDG